MERERLTKPFWLPITLTGSFYEEEIDINAQDDQYKFRHRLRCYSNKVDDDWCWGPAPKRK
jgi:hypothetical protein